MPNWVWYGAPRFQYREGSTWVAQTTIQRWSDESMSASADRMYPLASELADQTITLGRWQTEMRNRIKEEFTQQYLLGIGGRPQMTPRDWGSIGGMLSRQYRYLDAFAAEIAAGALTEKQIAARAALYMKAARQAFERASSRARGLPAMPVYPPEDCLGLTNCGCNWVYRRRGDEWHCTWTLGPTDHCEVCLGHAAEWSPLVVPIGEKEGRFVTIEGKPVFIGGPGAGAGGASGGTAQTAMAEAEALIINRENELAFAIGGGKTLVREGGKDYVAFEPKDGKVLQAGDTVFTHNHPSGTSFSIEDVEFAVKNNVAEIRAVGHDSVSGNDYLYRLVRPEGGWPPYDQVAAAMQRGDAAQRAYQQRYVNKGTLKPHVASSRHNHGRMWRATKELGWDYTRTEL